MTIFPVIVATLIAITLPGLRAVGQHCSYCAVQSLAVEPDYRAVRLNWRYLYAQEPPAFKISFCEISVWNSKLRCRQKYLPIASAVQAKQKWLQKSLPPSHALDKLVRIERGSYQASVYDLRMLTNYTFTVEADFNLQYGQEHPLLGDNQHFNKFGPHANNPLNVNEFNSKRYNVTVETKGFSGKTILCLSNASEVVVQTGPYFNGKIAVENAPDDDKCAIYGNQSDPLDIYTLTIHHNHCGSQLINNSRIETMIIVHENKEILTHNSRRFLVVCNFPPETYTLKASVEVPQHLINKRKKPMGEAVQVTRSRQQEPSDPNNINIYEPYKANNVHDSRILALHQEHKILSNVSEQSRQQLDAIIGVAFFVAGLLCCLVLMFFYVGKGRHSLPSLHLSQPSMPLDQMATKEQQKSPTMFTLHRSPLAIVAIPIASESYA